MRRALLAVLLFAGPVLADPPRLSLPPEIKAAGDYATLNPDTDGVSVVYVGQSGVSAFPSEFLRDPRAFVLPVRGLAAGKYTFVAVAASKTGEQASGAFSVVVGEPPAPPGPPPDPGPGPTDPFEAAVREAYTAAPDPPAKSSLAALYRQGAQTASLPAVATWGQLFDAMKTAAQTLGVAGKLPAVQRAVAAELAKTLPVARAAALDAAGRDAAAREFRRVAAALEGIP